MLSVIAKNWGLLILLSYQLSGVSSSSFTKLVSIHYKNIEDVGSQPLNIISRKMGLVNVKLPCPSFRDVRGSKSTSLTEGESLVRLTSLIFFLRSAL